MSFLFVLGKFWKIFDLFWNSDALLRQLQDQVNDLTLFLEEERFKHSETRRTNAEEMQETMRSMTQLREEETQ